MQKFVPKDYIYLHTSGHADEKTIEELIEKVKPKAIIPIHTENSSWFNRYKDNINVVYNTIR